MKRDGTSLRFRNFPHYPSDLSLIHNSHKETMTNKSDLIKRLSVPSHIKVTSFDSPEWAKLSANDPAWKLGKATVEGLWGRGNVLRYETFANYTPLEVRDHVFSFLKDEKMMDVEAKFYDKFGDSAALPYEEWHDKVMKLFPNENTFNPNHDLLAIAIDQVVQELREGLSNIGMSTLRPTSLDEAFENSTKGKNSGWPYFTKRWSDKTGDNYDNPEMVRYYKDMAQSLLNGVDVLRNQPFTLFKRTQCNGVNTPKMRPIEAPSKAEAIAAKAYTSVLIGAFKTLYTYAGFNGGENMHMHMGGIMKHEYLLEGDFSNFDTQCGPIMPYVFDVIRSLTEDSGQAYLNIIEEYYKTASLMTPIGVVKSEAGNGLFSGAGWTSVIGTIANAICVKYAMLDQGTDVEYDHFAFGDDIVIGADEFLLDKFEKSMTDLNMICNKEKQHLSTGPEARVSFLGYYHFRHLPECRGIFPVMRTLPGLVYRDKFVKIEEACTFAGVDEDDFAGLNKMGVDMLAFAKKLDNCRENAHFEELVRFFRDNEVHKMNTDMIVPFEKLERAVRCGRSSDELGLKGSDVMRLLYQLEELSLENLEDISFKLKSKVRGGLMVLTIERTVNSSQPTIVFKDEAPVDDKVKMEKAVIRAHNKMSGYLGEEKTFKKVKSKPTLHEPSVQVVKKAVKRGKTQADVEISYNGTTLFTFMVSHESEEELDLEVAKMVESRHKKYLNSNQLQAKAS
nr:MAG: RNA-dependent RNA polymerase [Chemarfal virus 8]